jgi:hypothetical protein
MRGRRYRPKRIMINFPMGSESKNKAQCIWEGVVQAWLDAENSTLFANTIGRVGTMRERPFRRVVGVERWRGRET